MSRFQELLGQMGATASPALSSQRSASFAPPTMPTASVMSPATTGYSTPGAMTGMGAGAASAMARGGGMPGLGAAVAGSLVEAGLPYLIEGGANLYDLITGAGTKEGERLADREKLFSGLQEQLDAANQEAIRRARAVAGQAIGGQLAMSGIGGLSSFNPVLAAQARQGEAQMAGRISALEQQAIQSRADYETGRAQAIDQALNSLTGSAVRRRNARRAYEERGMA